MQENVLYHMDCLKGMAAIPDQSIDLIICDLPYGTTACSWDSIIPFDKLWEQYKRIRKPGTPVVLFGAEPFSTVLRMSNLKEYRYDWYWEKNNCTGFTFAKYQPMRSMETISVFYEGKSNYFPQGVQEKKTPIIQKRNKNTRESIYKEDLLSNKEYISQLTGYLNNILKFPKETKGVFHPTQKPTALLEYLIKTYTKESDLVLDNCRGSGTTAVAAINTDRKFIGFELDSDYYTQAVQRIKENTTQLSLF
ncbi:DNA-methyltransferase [Enterococcus thailandicus]|uniref:DNA-methyltransferase n=1 Tax=Enterococcus thailandicus TaxID=417368 RepID=UPI0039A583C8